MRTNIVIDEGLMTEALACTGLETKKAVIEEALRTLVQLRRQSAIRALRGQLHWQGDLNSLRESRVAYTTDEFSTNEQAIDHAGSQAEGGDTDVAG